MPEDLPPEPSIKPLFDEQRRQSKSTKMTAKHEQPNLFDAPQAEPEAE